MIKKEIFYTKNGQHLGTAFKTLNTSIPLYPSVGLRAPGEIIEANFGESDFIFDIEDYLSSEKLKWNLNVLETEKHLDEQDTPNTRNSTEPVLDKFVLQHLLHSGHRNALMAYLKSLHPFNEIVEENIKSELDIIKESLLDTDFLNLRTALWQDVCNGQIGQVLKRLRDEIPNVLKDDESLGYLLQVS